MARSESKALQARFEDKKTGAAYKEAYQVYRKLAKQADQRLVRLEKYSEQEYFKGVLTYSYKRAIKDIESWSGEGSSRFNTSPPMDLNQLRAKISDIQNFLDAPTSTKKKIIDIYQRRADTINNKYGSNFTWQDLATYFESESFKKLSALYGSKTLMKAVGVIYNAGPNPSDIEEANLTNRKATKGVKKVADEILNKGYTYSDLFGESEAVKKAEKNVKKGKAKKVKTAVKVAKKILK